MKVIGKNRVAQQIDPKASRHAMQSVLQPLFAMVEVLSGDWIVSQQKASADASIDNVDDCHFARIKHFPSCQPCHDQTLNTPLCSLVNI
jgi:hypothetical protein